jgi:predicted molibdopterin-dependent oxidoreductase YjgC
MKFVEAGKIKDDTLRERVIAKVAEREDAWRNVRVTRTDTTSPWCGHTEESFRVDTNGVDVCTACSPVPEHQLEPRKVS